jgi:CHAD domain-containing protein
VSYNCYFSVTTVHRPSSSFARRVDAFSRAARRIDDGDVEAVHQARVASRRLREVIPTLGLKGDIVQKLSRRLKRVTKHLGAVRELDVLTLTIAELDRDSRYSSAAVTQLMASVQHDRVAARERLRTKLPVQEIQRLVRRLERAAKQSESANDQRGQPGGVPRSGREWEWAVDARATRRAACVRSAIETAGTVYDPERLHRVRIAVKKLRYSLELVAEARSQRGNRDINTLKATQDLLGRLHDLEILIGRARHEQASLSATTLTAWCDFDSLVSALEGDCRRLHARFVGVRTKLIGTASRIGYSEKAPRFRQPTRSRLGLAPGSSATGAIVAEDRFLE